MKEFNTLPFYSFLESSPIGFANVSLDGTIRYANQALCLFLGYSQEELLDYNFRSLTLAEDIDKDVREFEKLKRGASRSYTFEKRFVHKAGHVLWAQLHVSVIKNELGEIQSFISQVQDITGVKHAARKLLERETSFRKIFHSNPQPMVIYNTENLYFMEANEAALVLMGYSREELLNLELFEILDRVDQERAAKLLKEDSGSLRIKGEWNVKRQDGQIITVEVNSQLIQFSGQKARHLSITDVTDRKRNERQIGHLIHAGQVLNDISFRFVNSRPEEIDDSINEALKEIGLFSQVDRAYVFQLSDDGSRLYNTFEWCNVGIDPQRDNLRDVPVDSYPWIMSRIRKFKLVQLEDLADMPDEAVREKAILSSQQVVSCLIIPMHYENKLRGFVGFDSIKRKKLWSATDMNLLRSLTDLISWELIRKEKALELIQAKEQAEESSHIKSVFLATISHELRTPLNPILGFSSLIPDFSDDETVKEMAGMIHTSGDELLHLLEDLFDLSLADGNRVTCQPREVKGVDLFCIGRAILEEILISSGKQDQIRLIFAGEMCLFMEVLVDEAKTIQVLSILFKNAVKFTNEGEIEFGMQIDRKSKTLILSVRDTGIGMDEVDSTHIFEQFRQIDEFYARAYGGMGIGLSIVRKYVALMKGQISLNSAPGKGSLFQITLPVNPTCSLSPINREKSGKNAVFFG
jgi:PAS domain S-box-containing protein